MPRACSSGRRSVSLPVSARTSHVLPWSMCPAVPTVSGIVLGSGRPRPFDREARTLEQRPPILLCALAATKDEHQQVEPLCALRFVTGQDHVLEQEQPRLWCGGGANRAQDRAGALVVPVMQD